MILAVNSNTKIAYILKYIGIIKSVLTLKDTQKFIVKERKYICKLNMMKKQEKIIMTMLKK
jgi:hypothetical protein